MGAAKSLWKEAMRSEEGDGQQEVVNIIKSHITGEEAMRRFDLAEEEWLGKERKEK